MMTTQPIIRGKIQKKKYKFDPHKSAYLGKDSREGRLHDVETERGVFRWKDNAMEE